MNKSTLLIAALIIAAVIYLTACTDQRTPLHAHADDTATSARLDSFAAVVTARIDSLKAAHTPRPISAPTATASAPATSSAPAATAPTATICPTSYTPQRGALAGQPQKVHTGSRGGCYYFNASGNKTYLPK